jgi:YggT family protein
VILFANLLGAFADIIHAVLKIYMWIVIFRAILSWITVPGLYPVAVILYHLTEHKMGGIDVTPIIVILLILFVDRVTYGTLSYYAHQLREQALSSSPAFN